MEDGPTYSEEQGKDKLGRLGDWKTAKLWNTTTKKDIKNKKGL